ncbi:SGNH/GDSL hydrolase family protein [Pontibacter diazotrophicus]|uniref:SGNH/GDSL hydrolase family protein n=1 Tax=Pontibacter diazotrophicus TaxID=1400979 RepID=A0A3D8L4X4_9BACT|nr:SGNH/GDSL hydrolase family protein [Pontibacter diazotrophicus]RDV12559.1 SGNH/GDSL hydrolase family protein [Pontibacter diazotrophicus]
MKRHIYKSGMLALFAGILLTSCDPEIDAPSASAGELDLTKYVAVGNSLTAGYQDRGLYREAQLASYPALLAMQFEQAGGGEFVQPLFGTDEASGSGYLRIDRFENGRPVMVPVPGQAFREGTTLPGGPALTKYTDPVQNLGIPGISVLASASPQYGAINPYFERLLEPGEVGSKTYVQEVIESQPTFFSVWLGNNDVLGYATAGGEPTSPFDNLTDRNVFGSIYNTIIDGLTTGGAEGVLMTIADVTAVPFFTTVPYNALALERQEQVDQLNAAYGSGALGFSFQLGANPLIVRDPSAPAGLRQIKPTELVLLTALDSISGRGYGSARPLPDRFFLDESELQMIAEHTTAYNEIIRKAASDNSLALFDANAFFDSIKGGFVFDQVTYAPVFVSGNLFSLDGIHPTPRGYAILANEMIKTINAEYNANIPTVDVSQYRAVLFP